MKKQISLIGIILSIGRFGFLCFYNLGKNEEKNLTETEVNPQNLVTLSDLRSQFSRVKTGILLEPDEVKVLSDAKGKIQSISFPVGAEVKHGQPVIQIEDAFYLYTQGLDEAKTAYDNAQYQYDTRKNDSQKELSLIETEIKSLNTQMSSLENQIFSLSEMNQEKQEQKQQEALQKNQSLSQNLQNLWQDFSAQLSQIDTSELSFSSEYVSSLTSLSSSLSQGDFFSVLQSNRQFLSKFSDFCYLLHSAGREETFIASVLQQIKELQSQLDTLQSDFSSFFFDTFQTERQQSLTKLSQEIEEVEGNLNQKNLEYEERKNLIQTELKELSTTLDHTRNDYNNAYVTVNKLTSRSPQQGIIKKFFVGIGDFVEVGTPLFSLDVSKNSQIQVSLSFEELLSLSGINEAYIDIFDQSGALTTITGTILSRSSVADEKGNYMILISLPQKLDSFLKVLYLSFPLSSDFSFLPQNVFHEISNTTGSFWGILSGKEEKFEVPLGISWNGRREVLTGLNENLLFSM